jgi:hypothetical protein
MITNQAIEAYELSCENDNSDPDDSESSKSDL